MDFGCAFSCSRRSIDIVPIAIAFLCSTTFSSIKSFSFASAFCKLWLHWVLFLGRRFFLFLFIFCSFVSVSRVLVFVRNVYVCVCARLSTRTSVRSMMTSLGDTSTYVLFWAACLFVRACECADCLCASRRSSSRHSFCGRWWEMSGFWTGKFRICLLIHLLLDCLAVHHDTLRYLGL